MCPCKSLRLVSGSHHRFSHVRRPGYANQCTRRCYTPGRGCRGAWSVRWSADMADTPSVLSTSVTMCPFLSRAFVKKSHIVTFASSTAGRVSQWQRRYTAIAKMQANHSQLLRKDGNMSAVALGVGLGSLTHRGWHPSSTAVGDPQLRQSYITPHCIKCMASRSQAPFVSPHRFAPFGFPHQALCKIAFAEAVASRRRSPVASRPTRRRLSP